MLVVRMSKSNSLKELSMDNPYRYSACPPTEKPEEWHIQEYDVSDCEVQIELIDGSICNIIFFGSNKDVDYITVRYKGDLPYMHSGKYSFKEFMLEAVKRGLIVLPDIKDPNEYINWSEFKRAKIVKIEKKTKILHYKIKE